MWGLIGGSGFESFEGIEEIEKLERNTPFGEASPGLRRIRFKGHECVFLPRHGQHHELLPSEVNYRANMYALKAYGVRKLVSVSAVGSLRRELAPGDVVIPSQYIDRTKGTRKSTYCGDGLVGHVSLARPVWTAGVEVVRVLRDKLDFKVHMNKTYLCIEGPYFSTQAESHTYRAANADIIGMTNFPEFALAREAGISYLPCCFVTDYDCWDDTVAHVTLHEVLTVMKKNNFKAVDLITQVFTKNPGEDAHCYGGGLSSGMMTPEAAWRPEQKEFLSVLMKR